MISLASRVSCRRFKYWGLLFPLFCLAYFGQAGCASAQTAKQVQQIGDFYRQRDGFTGEIVVAQGGHILAETVYGYANQELKVPVTPDTRFAIGSVTKQFTAACILLLQEQGKLKTSDPVGLYLSSPPPAWKDVTIRDLLTHTSGITNDVLAGNAFPQFDHGVHTPDELINAVRELPLKFIPGSKYDYNNLGYVILGAVVEKASGQPFAKFLHDRILGPLDMKDTNLGGPPDIIPSRAFGYMPVGDKLVDADWRDPSVLGGAGAMYSIGADLVKWIDALENGRVLKPASLAEMNTPRLEDYGYGMFIENQYGVKVIGHLGDIGGFHAQVEFYPHSNAEFVVLSNISNADVEPKRSPGTYAVINELLELEANPNAIIPSSGKEYPRHHPQAHMRLLEMLEGQGITPKIAKPTFNSEHVQWMVRQRMCIALIRQSEALHEDLTSRPIQGVNWTIDSAIAYREEHEQHALPLLLRALEKRFSVAEIRPLKKQPEKVKDKQRQQKLSFGTGDHPSK